MKTYLDIGRLNLAFCCAVGLVPFFSEFKLITPPGLLTMLDVVVCCSVVIFEVGRTIFELLFDPKIFGYKGVHELQELHGLLGLQVMTFSIVFFLHRISNFIPLKCSIWSTPWEFIFLFLFCYFSSCSFDLRGTFSFLFCCLFSNRGFLIRKNSELT